MIYLSRTGGEKSLSTGRIARIPEFLFIAVKALGSGTMPTCVVASEKTPFLSLNRSVIVPGFEAT